MVPATPAQFQFSHASCSPARQGFHLRVPRHLSHAVCWQLTFAPAQPPSAQLGAREAQGASSGPQAARAGRRRRSRGQRGRGGHTHRPRGDSSRGLGRPCRQVQPPVPPLPARVRPRSLPADPERPRPPPRAPPVGTLRARPVADTPPGS